MWYGFYGDALSSGSGFDGRMDALCREIGGRGRAHASGAASSSVSSPAVPQAASAPVAAPSSREQLAQLQLGTLIRHAIAQDIDPAALDAAEESDDPHSAIVELLVGAAGSTADSLRAELLGLKLSALIRRAIAAGVEPGAMEAAERAHDARAALAELVAKAEG
eukprot:COSAG06_NODE_7827_length_2362_cov_2.632346_1_plen_164_part_10